MAAEDSSARRERLATRFKWGLGLGAALLVSPVVFLVVKGIVGLTIAFVAGFTVIQLAPVFSLKLANWRMKLLVAEVEANPIETMRNLQIEKTDELNAADEKIAAFETEVLNFDDELKTFRDDYPDDATTYQKLSERMHEALEDMQRNQQGARVEVEALKGKIKRAEAIYKMALKAKAVTALSKTAEAEVFADIKQQVAFDSVRRQLNGAFANLNVALARREGQQLKALPLKTGE